MDYEGVMREYLTLRKKVDAVEKAAKAETAGLKKEMAMLEGKLSDAARAEGLSTVTTKAGTGYWTHSASCRTANSEDFFNYVRENNFWKLLDKRPSKKAIGEYVDSAGVPPPGVDFTRVATFRIRENHND